MQSSGSSKKKSISKRRKWLNRIATSLSALVILAVIGATAVIVVGYQTTERPDPNADFQTATSFVYYNDGSTQLGSFAIQNRQPLTYEEMPATIKEAIIAAENRDFWEDPGISIPGMLRAAWAILRGEDIQGGSTITQQYIKIMYLQSEQTISRKFKEVFLAYKLNRELTKEQILESYLNTIYFGRGAYGIQAASKSYFDVDADELSIPQAAVLASVVNNPSLFDPSAGESNLERLEGRYAYVLQSMVETGAITAEQQAEYAELPTFPEIPINERYGGSKGFLLKMVESELAAVGFDASQISGGGLKITTTFDEAAQKAAVKSAKKWTKNAANAADEKKKDLHAAIASVDVGSGEVLALYGGPDYIENSRNWATTPRPTASTFKTYALAAALADEYSLRSTFNGNTFTPEGDPVPVRNEFSNQYGSYVSLLRATTESINTAFVDLTTKMSKGAAKIAEMAEAAGAPRGDGWDENTRLALGAAEVSPLDQAGAYATFANNGVHVANHVVREVTDASGKVLYSAEPEEKRAVSKAVAHDVTYALSNVVEQGTGTTVQTINRPVAGKTGTKDGDDDDITAAWFVAYTRQISTAVMYVAGDSGSEDLDDYARPGDSTFFGGTYPALTWADYMEVATEGQAVKEFPEPAWVNQYTAPSQQQRQTQPPATRKPATKAPEKPDETEKPTTEPTPTEEPTETEPPETTEPPATTEPPDPSPDPTEPEATEPETTEPEPDPTKSETTQPEDPTEEDPDTGGGSVDVDGVTDPGNENDD